MKFNKKNTQYFKTNKGFGILEIVIASAIVSIALFSLLTVFIFTNRLNLQSNNKIRANFLVEEGIEALRFLRDASWSGNMDALSQGTDYYISFATMTSTWSIETVDPGLIDDLFLRKVILEDVYRDSSDDIVTPGGTLDPDTKKFTVEVEWQERTASSTIRVSTYLSDIFDN